jgi:hypothetical protein
MRQSIFPTEELQKIGERYRSDPTIQWFTDRLFEVHAKARLEWAEIDTAGNLTTHIDKVSQQMLDQINTMRNQYQQSNYPELFGSLP